MDIPDGGVRPEDGAAGSSNGRAGKEVEAPGRLVLESAPWPNQMTPANVATRTDSIGEMAGPASQGDTGA